MAPYPKSRFGWPSIALCAQQVNNRHLCPPNRPRNRNPAVAIRRPGGDWVARFPSLSRVVDLSLNAGVLMDPTGVTRLQVISLNRMFRRSAVPILLGSSLLIAFAGCHRSPSADVVAT